MAAVHPRLSGARVKTGHIDPLPVGVVRRGRGRRHGAQRAENENGPNGRIHRQPQDVLTRLIQGHHFQRVLSHQQLHGQAPQRVPDQHVRRGQSARLEQAPEFFCDDGQEPRPFAGEVSDSILD